MFPSDALKDIWSRLLEAFSGDSCGGAFGLASLLSRYESKLP